MGWKLGSAILAGCVLVAGVLAVGVIASSAADPSALWQIVHGLCVPDERASHLPAPCAAVDLARGYAVLKDERGATQVLVIPTARVGGIESAAVLAPSAPDYWQDAWEARRFVERYAHRAIPRDDIALAVNSIHGRSQNQLHIHVDCVAAGVRRALRADLARIGPRWSRRSFDLAGRRYRAMWVAGADLGARNPFALLADGDPAARAHMGLETLALVGARRPDGTPGFVLLSDRADLAAGDNGHAESLMDHQCKVLSAPS
ncbi:MAG TPA: CDP-diacylglycerol diphosphatase [Caulobacteraceae bacterium]|nr:CDP-diacylglycerol diphosphatase [Caulobacteraceae bacterium]